MLIAQCLVFKGQSLGLCSCNHTVSALHIATYTYVPVLLQQRYALHAVLALHLFYLQTASKQATVNWVSRLQGLLLEGAV